MNSQEKTIYQFGNYQLDTENKILFQHKEIVPLSLKLFETLSYLVERSGRTVSKEEILENVWSETFVEESNLGQNIFQLRKILGKSEKNENYIKTIPKRGYRFIAPVKKVPPIYFANSDNFDEVLESQVIYDPKSEGKILFHHKRSSKFTIFITLFVILLISGGVYLLWLSKQPVNKFQNSSVNHSIAVLPFQQIGDENSDKQMPIGMADSLITKLSNLQKIKVRPISSVLQIKQTDPLKVGHELNVGTILTGTIQQTDDRIRVSVQLIDVQDGSTIWGEKFDTFAKNIFEVQDSISEQVSRSLVTQLNESENAKISKRYTNNVEAFEAFNKGRFFWNKRTVKALNKASEYFQHAIQIDPKYALAYTGLADSYLILASEELNPDREKELRKLAKITASKALEIDQTLAEPQTTLATITFEESGNWEEAEKRFIKSIELNPNYSTAYHWYSLHLLSIGQIDKAESAIKKALEIDPVSLPINSGLGLIYLFSGRTELAKQQFEKTLELDSTFSSPNYYLSLTLCEMGKFDESLSLLEDYLKKHPQDSSAKFVLGYVLSVSGNTTKAKNILAELERENDKSDLFKYTLAMLNANLGNKVKALEMMKDISSSRNLNLLIYLKYDPRINVLRRDRQFQNLFPRLY